MKLFKQFKDMVNSSVENVFAVDNKEEREATLPEKPQSKPVREESKKVTILKRFNNEVTLLRKLSEGSIKYDKEKKTYTNSKGKKLLPKTFSAKFVETDEKKQSLISKIEAPNLSTVGAGLGIIALIAMFGPQVWPFVKGLVKEVVSGIITEGIKALPEPMQKFIGWFTSSGDDNPATVSKSIEDQFVQGGENLGNAAKEGDEVKGGSEKFAKDAKEKVDDVNKSFKNEKSEKSNSEVDAIKNDVSKVEKKDLEDAPDEDKKEKKEQPEQEKKPTVATESKQEETKNTNTEPKIEDKKETTTPPPPAPKVEEASTKSISKPAPQPETKPAEPTKQEGPKRRGSLRATKTEPEAKPAAAVTASATKPSPAPTAATPTRAPTPSGSSVPSPVEQKKEGTKEPIKDNSVASSMNDAEGNPVEFAANKKITSTFGERVNPVILKETGKTVMQLHPGVDIAGGQGVPIGVLSPMKVVSMKSTENNSGYGFYLDGLFEKTGMYGRFGHMTRIDVKPGDLVPAGSIIGLMGGKAGTPGAGSSTGPHLHYEYRHKPNFGKKPEDVVDPMGEGISLIAIGKTVMDKSSSVAAQKSEPKQRTDVVSLSTTRTVSPKC